MDEGGGGGRGGFSEEVTFAWRRECSERLSRVGLWAKDTQAEGEQVHRPQGGGRVGALGQPTWLGEGAPRHQGMGSERWDGGKWQERLGMGRDNEV